LQRTVELFASNARVNAVIVAGPYEPQAFEAFKDRYADKLALLGVRLVRGGQTHRYETVASALAALPQATTKVAVHDAARPCAPLELIERVLDASERHGAVIPVVPVSDTIKQLDPAPVADNAPDPLAVILGDAASAGGPVLRRVIRTIPRDELVSVQTPQVFDLALLRRAHAQQDLASTDDAQLVERLGEPVIAVEGDARNIKITRPSDLVLARAILGVKEAASRTTTLRF
jgi:2-C-methyl-D-erythritol 4-phosphate cytidylyltransferase